MAAKKTAVGIDLGTTYSCVGVFQHGKVNLSSGSDPIKKKNVYRIFLGILLSLPNDMTFISRTRKDRSLYLKIWSFTTDIYYQL